MDVVKKIFVFTGVLSSMKRLEAIRTVEDRLGIVQANVTVKTDYLVVGHRQLSMFEPEKVSRKRELAEKLIEKGCAINIIEEKDFLNMLNKNI